MLATGGGPLRYRASMAPATIVPALRRLARPIGTLTPHPKNARNGDLDAITKSLLDHGQYAPVVQQKSSGWLIKGNHVYAAAMGLSWDRLAVVEHDCDDAEATRILLDDNHTSDLGQYDPGALVDLLNGLGGDYERTTFSDKDLTALVRQIERDAETPIDGGTGRGLGAEPVVSYAIIFDSAEDQAVWYAYLKWLRQNEPEGETIGARIVAHLRRVLANAEAL